MSSFLEKQRTEESYFTKIHTQSAASKKLVNNALNHFNKFCDTQYKGSTADEIIEEINSVPGERRERILYDLLQDYINYLDSVEIEPSSIDQYFSKTKSYLSYRTRIKIHHEDINDNLHFPQKIKRKKHVLLKDEIVRLVESATPIRKAFYLFMKSTGIKGSKDKIWKMKERIEEIINANPLGMQANGITIGLITDYQDITSTISSDTPEEPLELGIVGGFFLVELKYDKVKI